MQAMVKNSFRFLFLVFWLTFSSFYPYGDGLKLPEKKMHKAIAKLWKDKALTLQEVDKKTTGLCLDNGRIFTVLEQTSTLGYIFVGRVNSCRAGGCSIDAGDEAIEFEYFDYFFVTDTSGKVKLVRVFNYRATHGHEIMSRGWLRQFVGYSGNEELLYGKDIEAISGATVSANAINDDIQEKVNCLGSWLSDSRELVQNGQTID